MCELAATIPLMRGVAGSGGTFMRILIAEDDRALVMFLTRGMEADGHRVRAACDGAEALEAFRNEMWQFRDSQE